MSQVDLEMVIEMHLATSLPSSRAYQVPRVSLQPRRNTSRDHTKKNKDEAGTDVDVAPNLPAITTERVILRFDRHAALGEEFQTARLPSRETSALSRRAKNSRTVCGCSPRDRFTMGTPTYRQRDGPRLRFVPVQTEDWNRAGCAVLGSVSLYAWQTLHSTTTSLRYSAAATGNIATAKTSLYVCERT